MKGKNCIFVYELLVLGHGKQGYPGIFPIGFNGPN